MFFPPKFQSVITIIKNDYNVLHTGLLKYVHILKKNNNNNYCQLQICVGVWHGDFFDRG